MSILSRLALTIIGFTGLSLASFAQADTASKSQLVSLFQRVTKEVKEYKLDTTPPPDDKMTRKIIELRQVKGGFNINEVIAFKLEEDRQKNEKPKAELDKIEAYFKNAGQRQLNNAVIWIYRNNFTYKEIKQQVKFYRSSAGQKTSERFPFIMTQCLAAAEMLQEAHAKKK